MNAKKCFIVAAALNTLLLAFAASFSHQSTRETQRPANELTKRALTGPSGKFGPVIETVLPAAKAQGPANIVEILDLETGNALHQPSFEHSNSRVEAEAIMRWIRSNGLDISCFLLSNGAACVSYDMTIVPVEGKYWEKTTEQELLGNPALTPISHSPRRLLLLGNNRPDTYAFRTAEGTLGLLRIVGRDERDRGVKIRYKLINPAQSIAGKIDF